MDTSFALAAGSSAGAISGLAVQQVVRQGSQAVCLMAERGQGGAGVAGQAGGFSPCAGNSPERDERRLAEIGVLADLLAGELGGALGVDQIVADLERHAESLGIGPQAFARLRRGAAKDRAG